MLTGFDSLARVTGLDIVSDIIDHMRPIKQPVEGIVGAVNTLVACNGSIMVVMQDLDVGGTSGYTDSGVVID